MNQDLVALADDLKKRERQKKLVSYRKMNIQRRRQYFSRFEAVDKEEMPELVDSDVSFGNRSQKQKPSMHNLLEVRGIEAPRGWKLSNQS